MHILELVSYTTVVLFFLVLFFSIMAILEVKYFELNKNMKTIYYSILTLTLTTSVFYLIAQIFWIYYQNDAKIYSYETILWSIAEWLVAITLFTYVQSLRVFSKWRCNHACKNANHNVEIHVH